MISKGVDRGEYSLYNPSSFRYVGIRSGGVHFTDQKELFSACNLITMSQARNLVENDILRVASTVEKQLNREQRQETAEITPMDVFEMASAVQVRNSQLSKSTLQELMEEASRLKKEIREKKEQYQALMDDIQANTPEGFLILEE